jgi:hypothetical protein
MSKFEIDFFELAFLAEACIPPRPIARTMFWQYLTDRYWSQMTKDERYRLFEWMNRNEDYVSKIESNKDVHTFHLRFNPDNQYKVHTELYGESSVHDAFMMNERYYINRATSINEEYITKIEKV